jgi:hypothetical protein
MADFNTAFTARGAMEKSVGSIFADASLTDDGRTNLLMKNAEQYAEYLGIPVDDARKTVAKIASDAGAAPEIICKVTPDEQGRQAQERAAASRRRLRDKHEPSINPDPALIGEEDQKTMKQSTKEVMLKVARTDFANEVAKIRADNPKLSTAQARSIHFSQNPGLYASMRKWATPGEALAKEQPSSAELEVAEKTAAIQKAYPAMTHAQAYARAIEQSPGLMKRQLHGNA